MEIKDTVRKYISENHFKGAAALSLTDNTPLMSTGILDSIGILGLIDFLERTFQIEFTPRELDRGRLETIERIEEAVRKKLERRETS